MKHFRKIWDEEKNEWIRANKGLNKQEMYEAFMRVYPDSEVTFVALNNQRCRLGCCYGPTSNFKGISRHHRNVGSMHYKKGYMRIKVAEPNVWIPYARYLYEKAHPEYVYQQGDNFIFLDGDISNYTAENIGVLPIRYVGVFQNCGGTVKGCPEETKMHILQAMLRTAQLDAAERVGLVSRHAHGRYIRSEVNEKRKKKLKENAEARNRRNENARKRWHNMSDEKKAEVMRKHKEYLKEYKKGIRRRNKEEQK